MSANALFSPSSLDYSAALPLPPPSQLRLTAVEKGEERERGRGCRNSIAARFELTALEKEWRESPTLSSYIDA